MKKTLHSRINLSFFGGISWFYLQIQQSRLVQVLTALVVVLMCAVLILAINLNQESRPVEVIKVTPNAIPTELLPRQTEWLDWQRDSVLLKDGSAEVYFVYLAQDQEIEMNFSSLNPIDAEMSIVIGTIIGPPTHSANWHWSYRVAEYTRVTKNDRVIFNSEASNNYGILIKPRLDITVEVDFEYRVST